MYLFYCIPKIIGQVDSEFHSGVDRNDRNKRVQSLTVFYVQINSSDIFDMSAFKRNYTSRLVYVYEWNNVSRHCIWTRYCQLTNGSNFSEKFKPIKGNFAGNEWCRVLNQLYGIVATSDLYRSVDVNVTMIKVSILVKNESLYELNKFNKFNKCDDLKKLLGGEDGTDSHLLKI